MDRCRMKFTVPLPEKIFKEETLMASLAKLNAARAATQETISKNVQETAQKVTQKATKKAVKQLQKILDAFGKTEGGGYIETNNPGTWWTLDVEVNAMAEGIKKIRIGLRLSFNEDVIFDPLFLLHAKTENDKLNEVYIEEYFSQTLFCCIIIDGNDTVYGMGTPMQDEYGLKKRFSRFMDNITVVGPYLTNPKKIKPYEHLVIHD